MATQGTNLIGVKLLAEPGVLKMLGLCAIRNVDSAHQLMQRTEAGVTVTQRRFGEGTRNTSSYKTPRLVVDVGWSVPRREERGEETEERREERRGMLVWGPGRGGARSGIFS